jgi:hypothetical protein
MTHPDRPSRPSRLNLSQWIERWLVPSILVGVALLQLTLAHTANLSPWKGGGFGMFAAVDSPSMRTVAAEGLDAQGEVIRFDVLEALDPVIERRMRVFPKRSDLELLAPQLIGRTVVPTARRQQFTLQVLDDENPETVVTREADVLTTPLYRLFDDELAPNGLRSLEAVRLQWWQLRFDPSQNRIYSEPISPAVVVGTWAAAPTQP